LERALSLAEPEGYVRIFVDEGEPMSLLIADCRVQIEKRKHDQDYKLIGYIDKLLAAFTQQTVGQQSTISKEKSDIGNQPHLPHRRCGSEIVEPLSQRELEVLRLLRSDLSGPEIARELILSLATVRTHTQNIYAKLGVNHRRAAIRRAEELKLL
jgi:LuxR family transcriptional regulator, maltose regulon positive regulatory protein